MLSTLAVPAAAAHLGGYGFGFGLLFFIIPLFIIGLLFLFGGLARRRWSRNGFGPGHFGPSHFGYGQNSASRGAESTLAERFAQGDIDEKEYRARLEVLRANNDVTPASR
ncbi:MAG: SHOCT domain-containing protein [Rhodoglobus sp.]